jgi:26S proteasome regulatory subunit T6
LSSLIRTPIVCLFLLRLPAGCITASLQTLGVTARLDHITSDTHPHSSPQGFPVKMALDDYYHNKIEAMKLEILKGQAVLRRLEAQRNDYNSRVRLLREELGLLQQPGSYVGEVVKVMGTKKVLVKVHPEGKYGMFHCTGDRNPLCYLLTAGHSIQLSISPIPST